MSPIISDSPRCLRRQNEPSPDIHSGIVMDGHPPDQDPKGKSNVQTERRGCKISVSCRARGLWGSVEGCQIRYHHIKTSLRGDTGKEWHGFFRKTKAVLSRPRYTDIQTHSTHYHIFIIHCNHEKLAHEQPYLILFSFVFPHTKSPTYSEKCPMVCRHQIFNPPSPRFSQKSHYLCHPNKQ